MLNWVFLQIMSTKTNNSTDANGLCRIWGFTNSLFLAVGFHPKSEFSLMDHIKQKLELNNLTIRPLLEQVQEGLELDRILCDRFGFEQTVAQEMNFSDEFLRSIRFVRPAPGGVYPSYVPPRCWQPDLLNQAMDMAGLDYKPQVY